MVFLAAITLRDRVGGLWFAWFVFERRLDTIHPPVVIAKPSTKYQVKIKQTRQLFPAEWSAQTPIPRQFRRGLGGIPPRHRVTELETDPISRTVRPWPQGNRAFVLA